ncbi:hypothetical protein EI42_03131 [Thermosporothrix hazakensis]|jgi:hypothetical protein|uniref:Uncharacterized protein n=1 Tax=Thermosporothrix hazakensis TaxID=644383 RepID=A0A326U751_THEHA|nr:hypothetical protein [Thermosporothrix hazakensis]PZW28377.1 hypothetical protein EI42_03131 [Thermosporothrix hazakensis]GCE46263.1 hypothetical protein KTH_11320 [Thermosporothrix hazakensis]
MSKPKSPQELMATRNPLARKPVAPVDIPTPTEAGESETATESTTLAPAKQQSIVKKLGAQTTASQDDEIVRPYSTYLTPSQIKGIQFRAVGRGKNDYAIVQEALDEYFEKHPLPL